ncbi:MAG: ABC transporter permease [Betaproteobacteria bacterium]|nr:ABC transporter permease [Betaproteobacteria bacterium]
MIAWLRHHVHSFVRTLLRLLSTPVGSALNVVVIGVALALPLAGYILLKNLHALAGGFATQAQVSLFLDRDANANDVKSIGDRLRKEEGIRELRFVPRATALADLARAANLSEVVAALPDNPLPDAIVVTMESNDADIAENIAAMARSLAKVGHVQTDSAWTRRLDALIKLGRSALGVLSALLSFTLVAVTFNTIRLQILTQKEEIEVSRLVGATDSYIQRPFFYLGALLGILGGVVALALVFTGLILVNRDVSTLAALYGSPFSLSALEPLDCLSFLGFSALLGWLGAFLSVSIHLLKID